MDTQESVLEVDSWRKISCCTDCTRGLFGHPKSLHWKSTLREKSLAAPGLEPMSVLHLACQLDALPTELSPPLLAPFVVAVFQSKIETGSTLISVPASDHSSSFP